MEPTGVDTEMDQRDYEYYYCPDSSMEKSKGQWTRLESMDDLRVDRGASFLLWRGTNLLIKRWSEGWVVAIESRRTLFASGFVRSNRYPYPRAGYPVVASDIAIKFDVVHPQLLLLTTGATWLSQPIKTMLVEFFEDARSVPSLDILKEMVTHLRDDVAYVNQLEHMKEVDSKAYQMLYDEMACASVTLVDIRNLKYACGIDLLKPAKQDEIEVTTDIFLETLRGGGVLHYQEPLQLFGKMSSYLDKDRAINAAADVLRANARRDPYCGGFAHVFLGERNSVWECRRAEQYPDWHQLRR